MTALVVAGSERDKPILLALFDLDNAWSRPLALPKGACGFEAESFIRRCARRWGNEMRWLAQLTRAFDDQTS